MKTYSTIIRSIVTEKTSKAQEKGHYTFLISKTATKVDVKNAVKAMFGVEVEKVTTSISPTKSRLIKGKYEFVKRPKFKKATVTLKGKKTIDPNKLEFKTTKK